MHPFRSLIDCVLKEYRQHHVIEQFRGVCFLRVVCFVDEIEGLSQSHTCIMNDHPASEVFVICTYCYYIV